jgi:hypothetical protein
MVAALRFPKALVAHALSSTRDVRGADISRRTGPNVTVT